MYYNVSDSLWAGLAFGLLLLAGINSMVTIKKNAILNLQEPSLKSIVLFDLQLPLSYAIFQNVYENFPQLKERHRKLTYCLLFLAIWLINVPGLIPVLRFYPDILLKLSYNNRQLFPFRLEMKF